MGRPVPHERTGIRRLVIPIAGVVVLLLASNALASHPQTKHPHPRAHPCSQLDRVWSAARWRRGQPKQRTVEALHSCARWSTAKRRYYQHRSKLLWRERVTPFRGGGRFWAIPFSVVYCESGGRYHDPAAPNGAYALLTGPLQGVPTWESWRPGWASEYGAPYQAPKKAQDIAAHRLRMAYGLEPWECAGMVGLG